MSREQKSRFCASWPRCHHRARMGHIQVQSAWPGKATRKGCTRWRWSTGAICRALLDRGHDLGLIWDSKTDGEATSERLAARLPPGREAGSSARCGPAEVHVRHQWPPRLEPPPCGRWVLMQPWEYRQPSQSLAACSPPGRRGLGLQPLGPRLLPRCWHARRARSRHPAGS